jgi:predicted RNA binding protein YcfA (HicA-like mRNA interferase family)
MPDGSRGVRRCVSQWPSSKGKKVLHALKAIGWQEDPRHTKGSSHRQLRHSDYDYEYTWAFADSDEIGPAMLARIAKRTGLKPSDL